MWFSTFNNWAKTYYGPMLLRPASYVRGLRIMFGERRGAGCGAHVHVQLGMGHGGGRRCARASPSACGTL